MIYRKTPPQPPRLLLRVVTGVGALATAAGLAACSSSSSSGALGFVGQPEGDAGDSSVESCGDEVFCGIVAEPDSGGITGIVDGSVYFPESGTDSGPVGLVPMDSGAPDGSQDGGSDQ
jgi:hypothetical protein